METKCLNLAISPIVFLILQQSQYGSSMIDFHKLIVQDILLEFLRSRVTFLVLLLLKTLT